MDYQKYRLDDYDSFNDFYNLEVRILLFGHVSFSDVYSVEDTILHLYIQFS